MRNYLILAVIITMICGTVFAEEVTVSSTAAATSTTTAPATSSKPRFDIGAGYWYTWSEVDSKIYDPDSGLKISELEYDVDAGLFIVNADVYLFWRLYADGFLGWGNFEGSHEDSDWEPTISLTDLIQFSTSDADGDVTTWNANGYLRIIEDKEDKGYLDASLGYIYYRDDIEHLRNSIITISNYLPVSMPIVGHDSQAKYTFSGLRLGARGKIRLNDKIAIKAGGGIAPWLNVEQHTFWNLRDDFGDPPGRNTDGETDGTAFDFNIGLEIAITKNLIIEGGYRYMNFDSDNGGQDYDWIATPGIELTTDDNWNVEADRGGFYAMGRLRI